MRCFDLYRSSSGYSQSIDCLRFVCSIVILLRLYYSSFYAAGGCSRWILRTYVPGYCCFQIFVALLYAHSCMTLLGDVVWVLAYGACSVGVPLGLCFLLCDECTENRVFGVRVVVI